MTIDKRSSGPQGADYARQRDAAVSPNVSVTVRTDEAQADWSLRR